MRTQHVVKDGLAQTGWSDERTAEGIRQGMPFVEVAPAFTRIPDRLLTTTVTVQAGNTDDKLPQKTWADLCAEIDYALSDLAKTVHFRGASVGWMPWQNSAWVAEVSNEIVPALKRRLQIILASPRYAANSVAWTEGMTEFIQAEARL